MSATSTTEPGFFDSLSEGVGKAADWAGNALSSIPPAPTPMDALHDVGEVAGAGLAALGTGLSAVSHAVNPGDATPGSFDSDSQSLTERVGDWAGGVADMLGTSPAGDVYRGIESVANTIDSGDQTDGKYMGANGDTYSPNTPLNQIPPVTPNNNPEGTPPPTETVYYVNGMDTDAHTQNINAQAMANQRNANVISIRNGSDGFGGDGLQCIGDTVGNGQNAAADTLSDAMYQHVQSGTPMTVVAHSQGGIATDAAVQQTKDRMLQEGMPADEVERRMGTIRVETYGAASPSYPSGPSYVHNGHVGDPVSGTLGAGNSLIASTMRARGQQVNTYAPPPGTPSDPLSAHDFSAYIPSMRRNS